MKKYLFSAIMMLLIAIIMLSIASSVSADTLDIVASDLTDATDDVSPDHTYKIVQLHAGQGAGFDIQLDNMVCNSIDVSFRTGISEAGIIELRLESPDGFLLGMFDSSQYSPRDWATIHTAKVKFKKTLSGNCKIYIVNKSGVHTFHNLSFTLRDADSLIRSFSPVESIDFENEHNFGVVSANLLTQLGVLNEFFDGSAPVKRFEFALMLGKILKSERFFDSNVTFDDIPLDDDDSKIINGLYNLSVIKGCGNGKFCPNDYIRLNEAASICVNALGYGGLYDYNAVIPFASKLKLFKELDISGEYVTGNTAAGMLCNLFSLDSIDIDSVKNNGVSYNKSESFIEKNTDYFYGEGVVTSNYDTGLYTQNEQTTDTITIDNVEFHPGATDAYGYLGIMCKFFYRLERGKKVLCAIYPSDKSAVSIYKTSPDIVFDEISNVAVKIEKDGRKKEHKISPDIPIIFNGIALKSDIDSFVDSDNFCGTVTVISNGSSDKADCIWIDSAYTFLIEDIGLDIISDKNSDNVLEYKKDGFFVFADGITVSPDELKVGDVLTVYESANKSGDKLIRVISDRKTVSGEIAEVSGGTAIIDGKEYEILSSCHKLITPGTTAIFLLNNYSQIVTYEDESPRKFSIGLYMDYEETSNGFENKFRIKLLTEDSGVTILDIAPRVMVDGVNIKENKFLKNGQGKFNGMENVPQNTPVMYNLDSDGRIIMLDTIETGADNDADSLTQLDGPDSWLTLNRVLIDSSWRYRHPLSNNTKFIYFTADYNEDNYGIESGFNCPDDRITAIPYSTKKDSIIADIIFARNYSYSLNQGKEPFVFEKISHAINESGDDALYVCGYNSTGKVRYQVDMDSYTEGSVLKWGVDSLKPGDLIQVSLTRSMVTWIDIIYLPGGLRKNQHGYGAHIYEGGPYKISGTYGSVFYGNVIGVEDGFIKISFEDGQFVSYLVDGKMTFWSVSSNDRLNVETGKNVSLAFNDEKILLYVADGRAKAIFSYRDSMP